MLTFKLRQTFDACAKNAKAKNVSDSIHKSSLIYTALTDLYNTLKSSQEMQALFTISGLPYSEILDRELENASKRHLNTDFLKIVEFKKFEESIHVLIETLKKNMFFIDIVIQHPNKKDYYYAHKSDFSNSESEWFVIKIKETKEGNILISYGSSPLDSISSEFPRNANQQQMAIDFEEKFWLNHIGYGNYNILGNGVLRRLTSLSSSEAKKEKDFINTLMKRTYYSKEFYDILSETKSILSQIESSLSPKTLHLS